MDVTGSSMANVAPIKQTVQSTDSNVKLNVAVKTATNSSRTSLKVNDTQSVLEGNAALKPYLSVSDKALVNAIEHINKVLSTSNVNVQFSFHKASNTQIIKIVDSETHQVIKEIPPEKVLDAFVEKMKVLGLYFDERR